MPYNDQQSFTLPNSIHELCADLQNKDSFSDSDYSVKDLIEHGIDNKLISNTDELIAVYYALNAAHQNTETLSENQKYLVKTALDKAPNQYMWTIDDAINCADLITSQGLTEYKEMIINHIIQHKLYENDGINETNLQRFKNNFTAVREGNTTLLLAREDKAPDIRRKLEDVHIVRHKISQQSQQNDQRSSGLAFFGDNGAEENKAEEYDQPETLYPGGPRI